MTLWEDVARDAADNAPCPTWQPTTDPWSDGRHCARCGWGREIHDKDHAGRVADEALSDLVDAAALRLLFEA